MQKLHAVSVETDDPWAVELPERVEVALKEAAKSAKEGLLAFAVGIGLGVFREVMEAEVEEIAGPKGKHNLRDRTAYRHTAASGDVVLGGRKVKVKRPRARTKDQTQEIPLKTYAHFQDEETLSRVVLERMLAGVSTRRYARTQEPVGEEIVAKERSTSKSAISRRVVGRTRTALAELLSRSLDGLDLAALMIDGIELKERTHVVALGITGEGVKVPLGLWEGSTENATVATALLSDLQDRGLDTSKPILFVLDGAKALLKAARRLFGDQVPIHRCVRHKERNVLDHLPEREHAMARLKLRSAWADPDYPHALEALKHFASKLEREYPQAAGSLREGMEETLTLNRLGITGALKRTLQSTNPIESMIEIVRHTQRNVKRWRGGDMRLRWTAAGMLEAECQFRRVRGYRDIQKMTRAIEREWNSLREVNMMQAA